MSKILHITHPTFDISHININSVLIDTITDKFPNDEYHTSLGDMTASNILSISNQFELINFIPTNFSTNESIYQETILLLSYLQHRMPVSNMDTEPIKIFNDIDITTRPNYPALWVFGCSHSHGIGLSSEEFRYSNILSHAVNMPLISITKPGSSTRWSLRHLINANIQKSDLVIWQITTPDRISLAEGCQLSTELLLSSTINRALLEVYSDEQLYFDHLSIINYGVQYLRALGITFVLTSIENDSTLFYNYKKEYCKYKEYCYSPGFNVDTGDDNLHFGNLSHKNLALSIQDHIQYIHGKLI